MGELKRRVWKSGDEAAWLADKIVTGSLDYCQSAALLLRKYSILEQQLKELQRKNTMLVDAIQHADDFYCFTNCEKVNNALSALSAKSAEIVKDMK